MVVTCALAITFSSGIYLSHETDHTCWSLPEKHVSKLVFKFFAAFGGSSSGREHFLQEHSR